MATYNTAFGSLPGVETLTGQKRVGGQQADEEQPRDYLQQYRAQSQAQTPAQAQPAPTFAQLQQQGQARPAPPPQYAPAPAMPAPATGGVSMLDQLAGDLAVPYTGQAVYGQAAPAPSAPVSFAAPPAATQAPPPAGEGGGGAGGVRDFNQVVASLKDDPRFRAVLRPDGRLPYSVEFANTPEEKLDYLGLEMWRKENGIERIPENFTFVLPSQGGPAIRKLTFEEMVAQGYVKPGTDPSAYENIELTDYLLDTQGWIKKDLLLKHLQGTLGSNTNPWQGLDSLKGRNAAAPASFQSDVDYYKAMGYSDDDIKNLNLLGTAPPAAAVAAAPAAAATVAQPAQPLAAAAPVAAAPAAAPPTAPLPTDATSALLSELVSLLRGSAAAPAAAAPAPMPSAEPMAAATEAPPLPSFYPRTLTSSALPFATTAPAPTPAPTREQIIAGSPELQRAQQFRDQFATQLSSLLTGPTQLQGMSYDALRRVKRDELAAEYETERKRLEEEMARRGLSASTIGAGQYSDLAGKQARALAGLEAGLLQQQAEAEARNRQMYFAGMPELAKMESDIAQRTLELQQEASTRGRELDLQTARDLATAEYQRAQIQQGYAEIGSREALAERENYLRQQMQVRELTSAERRQLIEIEAQRLQQREQQTFTAEQAAQERALRETMQFRELTSTEKRQLTELEAARLRQQEQFTFQAGESALERQLRQILQSQEQQFQAEQNALERQLRETMQNRELTSAEKRQLQQLTADREAQERQFTFQRSESALERQLREIMQTRELTSAEKRQLDQITADRLAQQRQFDFQRGESAMDRALRERLGLTESTGILYGPDGKPVLDANGQPVRTIAGQQFEAGRTEARNAFLAQLAAALAPMSQKDRDAFIRNLPPELRALFGQPTSGVSSGGGTYSSSYGGYTNNIAP